MRDVVSAMIRKLQEVLRASDHSMLRRVGQGRGGKRGCGFQREEMDVE